MNAEGRIDRSLDRATQTVMELFSAALHAVEPARAVGAALDFRDGRVHVDDTSFTAPNGVHIVAVGKAAVAMTRGALDALEEATISGDVITKEGHVDFDLPDTMRVFEAGHPIPDERGVRATRHLLDALATLNEGQVVLALISGGGSALLEAPRSGVSLADLAETTNLLLRAGAPIDVLNAVRAPLSRVKAGGLRAAAPAATWVTLILSDVLGNDPRIIASGPTVQSSRNQANALALLDRFGVRQSVPSSIVIALTCQLGEPEEAHYDRDVLLVIGDNAAAVEAAAADARSRGLEQRIVWSAFEGEAADLGREFVAVVAKAPEALDVLLGGGEATVTVRGDGRGGRNTEFALAAALELERRGMHDWAVASLATDGQDALTGLAGAIVDWKTCQRARERGIDPEAALAGNDSATVFDAAGGAVMTGPTGTNVNDLYIAVRMRDRHAETAEKGN